METAKRGMDIYKELYAMNFPRFNEPVNPIFKDFQVANGMLDYIFVAILLTLRIFRSVDSCARICKQEVGLDSIQRLKIVYCRIIW
jgi:hypothetical protein